MKKFDPGLTVVVTSCDAYQDVERPFLSLFRKFWPDCPYELVLVAETGRAAMAEGLSFDRVLATGDRCWCEMLCAALEQVTTPYVLLLMNDYLLSAPVDQAAFSRRLEQAVAFDAANLRLNPNPPGRTVWRETDLMVFPKNRAYCVTCQTGIWNRAYLAGVARRNRSAWEFERFGSFMVGDEKRPLLVTKTKEFPFVDAVHKGYWEDFGVDLCRRHQVAIDFSARALPPLRVRLREGVKKMIFALFPATLIVRVQNIFNAGMKERARKKGA
jgi:hypothetical protein